MRLSVRLILLLLSVISASSATTTFEFSFSGSSFMTDPMGSFGYQEFGGGSFTYGGSPGIVTLADLVSFSANVSSFEFAGTNSSLLSAIFPLSVPPGGPAIGGLTAFTFDHSSPGNFSLTAVALGAPGLELDLIVSGLGTNDVSFSGYDAPGSATISSLTLVPEPSSVECIGLTLFFVVCVSSRRRRRQQGTAEARSDAAATASFRQYSI